MVIDRRVLDEAVARGEITPQQAIRLIDAAAQGRAAPVAPRVRATGWRVLAAALLVALGPGLAVALAFDQLGFAGLLTAAAALALALLAVGWRRFSASGGARGEVLLCGAVLLAPLAAHGAARVLGLGQPFAGGPGTLLEWLAGPWFLVQAATVVAALLALRAFGIPFLAAPLAVAVWFGVQDAAPLLFGPNPGWDQRALLSALSGLVFLAAGVALDRRTARDLAFWLYLPGQLALLGGLVTWTGASTLSLALVALLHAGLVLCSLLLGRRSFAVTGALGLAATVGRLADDLLTPTAVTFTLAAVTLALLGLGFVYHQQQARLEVELRARLPRSVQRLLPAGRG